MKEKLEALANEMVDEVKNLKDLTKEQLPLVAQEYVSFSQSIAALDTIIFGTIFLLSSYGSIRGFNLVEFSTKDGILTGLSVLGFIFTFFGTICSFQEYLAFKLQPRLKAIEGIVKLFKGKT